LLGVDPWNLTARQLLWMAEGRQKHDWQRTSALMALIANVHRDPRKGRALKAEDFDPTRDGGHAAVPVEMDTLKKLWQRQGGGT
jgi:hypothetical protein